MLKYGNITNITPTTKSLLPRNLTFRQTNNVTTNNFTTNNTIINMIEVENLVGQKIISQTNSNNTLDISYLSQGVFIIKFYDNQNHIISISKIIKQ